jgi:hypothetical protein
VARSYLSTLDLLVPVEASVSGVIGSDPSVVVEERLMVVRDRYTRAMDYLKSADDSPGANGRSKLATYVMKQEAWSKTVEAYTSAQNNALANNKPPAGATTSQVKEARELYMQWIQEHGRDVCLHWEYPSLDEAHDDSTNMLSRRSTWTGSCMVTNSWYEPPLPAANRDED